MKKSRFGLVRIILIAALSVVAILALAGFVACSDDETANYDDETANGGGEIVTDTRQVPVYQGMVISSANAATSYGVQSYSASGSIVDDNVSGDIVGREGLVDENHPFGDDSLSIEQEVEKEFRITGVGQDIYYADKNEDVFVTVKFSNPNDFEILSFRINGQTYASYMFQDGSDMENIIIKLNVGSVVGFNEYEISEIKYVDGTDIKDVLLNGDTVVRCGVRGDEAAVSVSVANESVTLDEISFNAKVTDKYSLIEESDGYAVAILYDGSKIIDSKSLSVGDNSVSFTKLDPNTLYQYAVVGVYDDLSGNGVTADYPYVNSVYTETIVLFDNVVVTKTGVSFEFAWYEGYDDSYLHTKFTLEGGSSRFEEIEPTTEITGLLSDHEYTLNVAYTGIYGETEAIRLTFRTLAMDAPEVEISASTTQDSLSYTVSVTDTDEVGNISSVSVYRGGDVVYAGTDTTGTIDDLFSGNEYEIVVVYAYNLNDGTGIQTMEVSKTISTVALRTPSVSISLGSDKTEIDYELTITDVDETGEITSVVLSHAGSSDIEGSLESSGSFDNLLSNNEYTLTVVYTYNLNDGVGEQTLVVSKTISTLAMETPEIEISSLTSTKTGVEYELTVTDTDSVGEITSVTLSHAGSSDIEGSLESSGSFDNLLSNNEYTLTVVYTYDLNDGTGSQTIEISKTISTLAKAAPVVDIELIDRSSDSLTFAISYTDEDNVGQITAIEFYNGGELVDNNIALNEYELTFKNLDSYTQYSLKVTYKYNLNDGNGLQEQSSELFVATDPTIEFESIAVLNSGSVSEGDTIYLVVSMNNPSNAVFSSVVINEISYNVSSISSASRLYIEIVYEGQFAGGNTELVLSAIAYIWEGEEYLIDVSSNNIAYVFINGELYVDNFTLVSFAESGVEEERLYKFKDEAFYYKIELSNATGYDIGSVTIGGTGYSKNDIVVSDDKQIIYVPMSSNNTGWRTVSLTNISYSNDSIEKSKVVSMSVSYLGLSTASSEIVEIYTADDLKDVSGWKYFKLMNDIDLSGYEWINIGNSMQGVFNGNGHKIYNVGGYSTYFDETIYLGVFESIEGIVMNLEVCDVLYMVTLNSSSGSTYSVYAGGLSAKANQMVLIDCYISSSYLITNTTGGNVYIGTLSGSGSSSTNLYSVVSYLTAEINSSKYNSSGYFGDRTISSSRIIDCSCDCRITASTGSSEGYIQDGEFIFSIDDGVYSLIEYTGDEKSLILPSSIDGHTYEIGEYAFSNNSGIEEINIPDGVTAIGKYSFYYCKALVSISISDSVTSIGDYAFYGCSSLTSIEITENIISMGEYVFYGCTSLTEVYYNAINVSNPLNNRPFYNAGSSKGMTVVIGSNVESLPSYFIAYSNVTCVIFDDGTQCATIGDEAFYKCSSLASIAIPESITKIGMQAFYDCVDLTEIYYNAINVDDLASNSNVFAYVGQNTDGTTVTIGSKVKMLPKYLFYDSNSTRSPKITSVVFVEGSQCTSIGQYAFYNCSYLTQINIPDTLTAIEAYAFYNCSSLEAIYIPKGTTTVGIKAFYGCFSLLIFAGAEGAESLPNTWNSNWNPSGCTVYWGFFAIPTDNVLFTFDANGGSYVESISAPYLTTLPTPIKDGYIFLGWYTDQDYTNYISGPFYAGYDITLYAKWLDINNPVQSTGLEIVDGVIVGIGTCTDAVLVICMPVAEKAFVECLQITTIYLFDGCDYIGYRAFYSCDNLKTIYFYQTEMPTLESDILGNTWDASDFMVYVLQSLYSQYLGVSDNYWQTYLVDSGKLAYM